MPRAGFEVWLARRYPGQPTGASRFANVARIESFYGSIEDHYRRDRCVSLFLDMAYSGNDRARNAPNPSKIPVNGDLYNGLGTLRSALKLYVAYLDEDGGRPSGLPPRFTHDRGSQPSLGFSDARPPLRNPDAAAPNPSAENVDVEHDAPQTSSAAVLAILRRYTSIKDELTALGVLRTGNIVGEYGEWLFARAFGWRLTPPSERSHDAVDDAGLRYQIKARQDVGRGGAHQLGIIRDMVDDGWTAIAAVIFERDFAVRLAVIAPREVVAERVVFSGHQRGHILRLDQGVIGDARVRDVTRELRAAQR